MLVYLNGKFLPHAEARVSVDDRGFLFADGVYEVVRLYRGRPFHMDEHFARMMNGLRELRIPFDDADGLRPIADRLLEENRLGGLDATLYLQITRGAAPRKHAFPTDGTAPTVYAAVKPLTAHPDAFFDEGVAAITVPENRWARCDIKSISLLPNVMANQAAKEADAFEALFVRDGVLLEGSHSNLFGVVDGTLLTYPSCNYVLPGITRDVVLDIARDLGIPSREAPIYVDRYPRIEELFLSGTTTEVMPVTRLDGRTVGSGALGPVTRRIQHAFRERTAA